MTTMAEKHHTCIEHILLFDSSSLDEEEMKTRGKKQNFTTELGYFTNLVQELKIEDA